MKEWWTWSVGSEPTEQIAPFGSTFPGLARRTTAAGDDGARVEASDVMLRANPIQN